MLVELPVNDTRIMAIYPIHQTHIMYIGELRGTCGSAVTSYSGIGGAAFGKGQRHLAGFSEQ